MRNVLLLLFFGWAVSLSALELGDDAPNFYLYDQEDFPHSLQDNRGRYVLIFFYPRDFAPSSIKEVRSFEKAYPQLKEKDVVIYGVSNDPTKTHRAFHEKFKLTYDLLSDPGKEIIRQYGAESWGGTKIVSYLIGPDGRIFRKYESWRATELPMLALQDLN